MAVARRLVLVVLAGSVLAACDPQAMMDDVARSAARSVVVPVVNQYLPGAEAEMAAICIIDNASSQEIQSLARDVGTRAGTTTVATILSVAQRPATLQCLLGRGLAPLPRA